VTVFVATGGTGSVVKAKPVVPKVYRKNKRYFATATVRITQSDGSGKAVHPA